MTRALTQWRERTCDPLLDAQNLALLTAEVSAVKSRSEGKQLTWGYPDYFIGKEPVTPVSPSKPSKKKKKKQP